MFYSQNLPFKQIKHVITEQDSQPTIDSCILIMVFGQLKVNQSIIAYRFQVVPPSLKVLPINIL